MITNSASLNYQENLRLTRERYRSGEFWLMVLDESTQLVGSAISLIHYLDAKLGDVAVWAITDAGTGDMFFVCAFRRELMTIAQYEKILKRFNVDYTRETLARGFLVVTREDRIGLAAAAVIECLRDPEKPELPITIIDGGEAGPDPDPRAVVARWN
jgi:hypothetical protein